MSEVLAGLTEEGSWGVLDVGGRRVTVRSTG